MADARHHGTTGIQHSPPAGFHASLMQAGQSPSHLAHQRLHVTKLAQITKWHRPQGLLTQGTALADTVQQKLAPHLTSRLLTDPGSPLPQLLRPCLLTRVALIQLQHPVIHCPHSHVHQQTAGIQPLLGNHFHLREVHLGSGLRHTLLQLLRRTGQQGFCLLFLRGLRRSRIGGGSRHRRLHVPGRIDTGILGREETGKGFFKGGPVLLLFDQGNGQRIMKALPPGIAHQGRRIHGLAGFIRRNPQPGPTQGLNKFG